MKKACIIWIPTITHEKPMYKDLDQNSKKFRISDYTYTKDPLSENYMELWGEVKRAQPEENNYDLDIIVYKHTSPQTLLQIQKLGVCQAERNELSNNRKSWINKIFRSAILWFKEKRIEHRIVESGIPSDVELHQIHRVRLTHCISSRNGMMCYIYDFTKPDRDQYNIFEDGNIPHCIYHHIKGLFHAHEFHDSEHDTILTPYCFMREEYPSIMTAPADKASWEKAIENALGHYLESFHKFFHSNRSIYSQEWRNMLSKRIFSFYGVLDYKYWFLCIISSCIICYGIYKITSFWHMAYIVPVLIFTSIFIFLIYRWNKAIGHVISNMLLRIEGEYGYVQSLFTSKYIKNSQNDICRIHIHNVKNDFKVTRAYLEAMQRKGHMQFAIWSIALSIAFVVCELIVAYGLDTLTTGVIQDASNHIIGVLHP